MYKHNVTLALAGSVDAMLGYADKRSDNVRLTRAKMARMSRLMRYAHKASL